MNTPPLIRLLRRALQPTTARCARQPCVRQPVMRPLASRWNSSMSTRLEPTERASADATATDELRFPRSVQSLYLQPLRRECEFGVPTADLQMRAYNVRHVEFFADFAMRAAYYLGLPAFGPVPLPRITERWTVPRGPFVHKKSQENFERITVRRLVQIRDGHPDTVQVWLAFLQKHAYPGVGLKANVWEYSQLGVGRQMDAAADALAGAVEWERLGEGVASAQMEQVLREAGEPDEAAVQEIKDLLLKERVKASGGR